MDPVMPNSAMSEASAPAYRRGVAAAEAVRRLAVAEHTTTIDAGDTSLTPERNLRRWMRDHLAHVDATDPPTLKERAP